MSGCSLEKVLPAECIHEIISHLTHDSLSTLNSCIRTSRLFARLSVFFLYKNPWKYFEIEEEEGEIYNKRDLNPKGALLLRTYLSCLNEPTKFESAISETFPKTIMDYISFTRHINIPMLYNFLEVRLATIVGLADRSKKIQEAFSALSEAFSKRCVTVESLVTWKSTPDIFTSMILRFPNIAHLDLLQYENTDETIKFIGNHCKRLCVFKFTVCNCSPKLLSNFLESQGDGYLDELCIKITTDPKKLLTGLSPSVIAKITDLRINGLHIDHAMDNLKFQKLRSLDLSDCHSMDEKAFSALQFGQMITEINLSETKISEAGVISLATHCKHNLKRLIMLPCGAADSVEQGIRALATHCPNLEEFRLDVIRVEIKAIMELIQSCRGIQILVLGGVEINNDDLLLDELMDSIRVNIGESIKCLDLREWSVSEKAVIDLTGNCPNLDKLVLRYCRNVNDNCIKAISNHLARTLRHLDVANCPLVTPDEIMAAEEKLVNCRIIHASKFYCID